MFDKCLINNVIPHHSHSKFQYKCVICFLILLDYHIWRIQDRYSALPEMFHPERLSWKGLDNFLITMKLKRNNNTEIERRIRETNTTNFTYKFKNRSM
jgi:hypothetical protein